LIDKSEVVDSVRDAVITASTTFRDDQKRAYKKAIRRETNKNAKWVLERILEDATIAEEKRHYPLCNDTGTPHVYVEIGENAALYPGFFGSVLEGVRKGLRDLPARPMAVKGGPMERIAQQKGLYDDPGQMAPFAFVTETVPGSKVQITLLMQGGGPELRSKTYRIYHTKSADKVLGEAASWAIQEVAQLGCTPCVPALGIGRTHYEATVLMLRALAHGSFDRQSKWEKKITGMINETKVGPIGIGGKTTALGTFIEIGPQRASGARIVCVRPGCCYDPRRATVTLG
jgi:fumarate hydratase subunit alpha